MFEEFIRRDLKPVVFLVFSSNQSLQEAMVILLKVCIISLSLKQDIIFLKTLSFRQLLFSGINLIMT